jgi:hypothetical protein
VLTLLRFAVALLSSPALTIVLPRSSSVPFIKMRVSLLSLLVVAIICSGGFLMASAEQDPLQPARPAGVAPAPPRPTPAPLGPPTVRPGALQGGGSSRRGGDGAPVPKMLKVNVGAGAPTAPGAKKAYYNVRQTDVNPDAPKANRGQFAKKPKPAAPLPPVEPSTPTPAPVAPVAPAAPAATPYSAVIIAVGKGDRAAAAAGPPGRFSKAEEFRPTDQQISARATGDQCGALVNGWILPGKCQENPGRNVWPTHCQVFFSNPSDWSSRYWKCIFGTDDRLRISGYSQANQYNQRPVPLDLPTPAPRKASQAPYADSRCGQCRGGECCRPTQQSSYYQCMQC